MTALFLFPKPRDWETFEDIVCDVMARKLSCRNLQRYARQGQTQAGVDIVGKTNEGIIGIQCKHHLKGNIPLLEIDQEITKSDVFTPRLNKLIIATSADRDGTAHSHVLTTTLHRETMGDYPIEIKFWEDITNWLDEYPDLIYKHFTKYFPIQQLEKLQNPLEGESDKATLSFPTTPELLQTTIIQNLAGLPPITPYQLTIGLTTFPQVSFKGLADLEIQLASFVEDEERAAENFIEISKIFHDVETILHDPFYSRELWIQCNTRLSIAFLVGWIFRRVSRFRLMLIERDQIWSTEGLPYVPSDLMDDLPIMLNNDSREIVMVLNIIRPIDDQVIQYVDSWEDLPKAILIYNLQAHTVRSAAHALSIAYTISQKLKLLMDRGGIRRIHLFAALPASLAVLITHHLNAIYPISVYFFDRKIEQYRLGGTLFNDL